MRLVILLATCAAVLTACSPQRIAVPVPPRSETSLPPRGETIVLLRDAESGLVGRARVSTPSGSVELTAERDATRVTSTQAPSPVTTLDEANVALLFGAALSALPLPPLRFTLHFRFESGDLTDQAVARVPEILQALTQRPVPDVAVVGHTDTTGAFAVNHALGLKRATTVRDLLVAAGLDHALIEVISHGERDLLIQTADETLEPRNRRVEIAVR